MDISRLKSPLVVLGTGLALGLTADRLLYGQPAGISIPIIAVLLVAALLILARIEGVRVVRANLWLIAPLLFLAAMSAVRAAPLLRMMNLAGALLLLGLLANRLAAPPIVNLNLGGYIGAALEGTILSGLLPVPVLARSVQDLRRNGRETGVVARRLLVGALIAAPFLCAFTVLFSSADLVFGGAVEDIIATLNLPDLVGHAFLTLILAWVVMGGLTYALTRGPGERSIFSAASRSPQAAFTPLGEPVDAEPEAATAPAASPIARRRPLGTLESGIVLFSVDALFLVFVSIQFAALFGGEAFLRSRGLTYSEYARRGFFELLAVSLITLALILGLEMLTRRETRTQRRVFLLGCGLLIGLTIVILASAFQRMQLYELAYGFTILRVYPHIFMVWLAALLVYVLAFLIADRPHLFATGALAAALGFAITLNVLNPDAFIVRQNVARYERGEPLDVDTLGRLSEDAVPLLIPLLHEQGPEIGAQVGPWLRTYLMRLDARQQRAGWPSYHVSINRAYRLLDLNRGLIEQFEPPGW